MSDERRAAAEVDALAALLDEVGLGAPATDESMTDTEVARRVDALVHAAPDNVVPLRRRRRSPWTVAAGAAAAVLLAVGIGLVPSHLGDPVAHAAAPPMLAYPIDPEALAAGEGEPAGDRLAALSAVAGARVDPEPVGDVQHTLSQSWLLSVNVGDDSTTMAVEPTVGETWIAPDGSATFVQWRGPGLAPSGALVLDQTVDTAPANAAVDVLPAGTFDPDQAADLSRDPATLRAELLGSLSSLGCDQPGSPNTATCLYLAITDLADRLVLPADLDAALWQVLADEPGLSLAGTVTDRVGEGAVALAFPAADWDLDPTVRVLLIDPDTGAIAGREEVTLSSELLEIDEPTVTQFRYDLAVGWTDVTGPQDS